MILAAIQSKTWLNWFDVALVGVLAFGLWRGRKNGMSKELLPVSTWLGIVLAAGLGYAFVGDWMIQAGIIKKVFSGPNPRTPGYITAYLLIAVLVWLAFYLLKKYLKPKLEGSNAFGALEYYLGMASGLIRYACMFLFALALLNAPSYSAEEISARKAYNNRWYGGGVSGYEGNFIPELYEVQAGCFRNSLLGPFVKQALGGLFISTVGSPKPPAVSIQ